jgi:ribosomal protein S5
MVLDLLDPATLGRLVGIIVLMVLGGAVGYAKGFKEGKREGMARRKAIRRHIANAKPSIITLPSDIKIADETMIAVSRHIANKAVK